MTENAPCFKWTLQGYYIHIVVCFISTVISRTFLSSNLETLYPLNGNSPLPLPSSPVGMFPFPPCNALPGCKSWRPCEFISVNLWFPSRLCSTASFHILLLLTHASFHRLLSWHSPPWCGLVRLAAPWLWVFFLSLECTGDSWTMWDLEVQTPCSWKAAHDSRLPQNVPSSLLLTGALPVMQHWLAHALCVMLLQS